MINLKRLGTSASIPEAKTGDAVSPMLGFYFDDTRHLSRFDWNVEGAIVLSERELPGGVFVRVYTSGERHGSDWAIIRELRLENGGFTDTIRFENYTAAARTARIGLSCSPDFTDLMQLRYPKEGIPAPEISTTGPFEFTLKAGDGVAGRTSVSFSMAPDNGGAVFPAEWSLTAGPGEVRELRAQVVFQADTRAAPSAAALAKVPGFDAFAARFADLCGAEAPYGPVVRRAVADLYGLLDLAGEELVIVAGLPAFNTPFGRDSFLTARFLLNRFPELAAGTLAFAAAIQGRTTNPSSLEEHGKIFHEIRSGELSRTARIPFARYYGSADSTPLFVILLEEYWRRTGDAALLERLEPTWLAAADWILGKLESGRGFIRFRADATRTGLKVQSWKDSPDALCFSDGTSAQGDIAASEVQAYAYGALQASVRLAADRGLSDAGSRFAAAAARLKEDVRNRFWIESEGFYALALDGEDRPLGVPSSNSGHCLAFRLESDEAAGRLADRLLQPDLFAPWGVRTLGSRTRRFNPLSYHNGSIWPIDNAMVAEGLYVRGFEGHALRVCDAVLSAVDLLEGRRAPELFAGYGPDDVSVPVTHPFSCAPQAWAAAGVLHLAELRRSCLSGGRASMLERGRSGAQ